MPVKKRSKLIVFWQKLDGYSNLNVVVFTSFRLFITDLLFSCLQIYGYLLQILNLVYLHFSYLSVSMEIFYREVQ